LELFEPWEDGTLEKRGQVILDTERLQIRSAGRQDAVLLFTIWTDPRAMTHVGYPQGLRITQKEIAERIAEQDFTRPFGRVLIVDIKEMNSSIGECKMYLPDEEGTSRTDVKLVPEHWGHKYGVEVKQALVDYLFEHTECHSVEGTPNVNNVASIKMQEAVGAVRLSEDTFHFPESMAGYTTPLHHYIYHVYRSEWEQRRKS
jgi:RimJ/RimL family protein N-acetyltransferase